MGREQKAANKKTTDAIFATVWQSARWETGQGQAVPITRWPRMQLNYSAVYSRRVPAPGSGMRTLDLPRTAAWKVSACLRLSGQVSALFDLHAPLGTRWAWV
ncbi:hypothetical protein RRG08_017776 [Elysia crispata]|uniref:Uncharacterized protein n=1 Tax=Elysia crispata TaxID=231223 RepID=A0AAE0YX49_9GAST|nr:hypothetical protein RRG08_017776 [Elysia crispata]